MTGYYESIQKCYVAVDCIILGFKDKKLKILIGRRRIQPGAGEWSLYGGFMRPDESIKDAARRTLRELTGIRSVRMQQIGTYGEIERDPGGRVISVVYGALINIDDYDRELLTKYGLKWVDIDHIPLMFSDHNLMIRDALTKLRQEITSEPICFNLLPRNFTLTQLQNVFEAIMDKELDKRNFRKRIKQMDFIEKTELIDKVTSKRGAALYTFNKDSYLEDPKFKL